MTITIPDELDEFVRANLEAGEFKSPAAVVLYGAWVYCRIKRYWAPQNRRDSRYRECKREHAEVHARQGWLVIAIPQEILQVDRSFLKSQANSYRHSGQLSQREPNADFIPRCAPLLDLCSLRGGALCRFVLESALTPPLSREVRLAFQRELAQDVGDLPFDLFQFLRLDGDPFRSRAAISWSWPIRSTIRVSAVSVMDFMFSHSIIPRISIDATSRRVRVTLKESSATGFR